MRCSSGLCVQCVLWQQTVNCSKCCHYNIECFPTGGNCSLYSFCKSFQNLWGYGLAMEENMKMRFFFLEFIYQIVVLAIGLAFCDFFTCSIFHIIWLETVHVSGFHFYELIMKLHFLLNCSSGSRWIQMGCQAPNTSWGHVFGTTCHVIS